MIWLSILIFGVSAFSIAWSGSKLVDGLMKMAKFLGWREFVVAFFIMAIAGSFPNLLIGVNSALHKIPQLSFGDVLGGNIVDLTLAVAASVLLSRSALPAESRMVQSSAFFTAFIAILPLILILDGRLGRIDGLILIIFFFLYMFWLFSKSDRFKKVYEENRKDKDEEKIILRFKHFLGNLIIVLLSLLLLILSSEGIIISTQSIGQELNLEISIIGLMILGLGNALPETYFAVASARKGQNWMILGDLMGSVIVCATLILGLVSFIQPIQVTNFSSLIIAFIFLTISALFFLIVIRTGRQITKREALFLLLIYFVFLITEVIL